MYVRQFVLAICGLALACSGVRGDIFDLRQWTLVEDPPNANFGASISSSAAVLTATAGSIPVGVDIGLQSVDGSTPLTSTSGYFFSRAADFTIAIDYSLAFSGSPTGFLGIGFGIGEDSDGENSAGIAMLTQNGNPFLSYVGVSRIGDVNQPAVLLPQAAALNGSLFISYAASSGDVVVGAATAPGANTATATATLAGIQNAWNDSDLMASFFLRSDGTGWQGGGTATATFSNMRVLAGTPTAVPEPSSAAILSLLAVSWGLRRSQGRTGG